MIEEPRTRNDESSKPVFQFSLRDLLGLMAVAAIILTTTVYSWDFADLLFRWSLPWIALAAMLIYILPGRRFVHFAMIATAIYFVICCLGPAVITPGFVVKRMVCGNNMKYILLALHNYHDTHGSFPPAYIADENGKPIHSWRVLILPFVEQKDLYGLYDFNESWDGPNNRRLISELPDVYRCPEQRRKSTSETNYVAVIGPRTAWPGDQPTKLADFADGTATSLLIVEVVDSGIPWTAPQDLTLEEALKGLQKDGGRAIGAGHPTSTRLYAPTSGAALGYADAHVERLWKDVPTEHWQAVLQIDDGEPISESSGFSLSQRPRH